MNLESFKVGTVSDKITHIGQLKPDQRNPRRHNQRNLSVITDSLQQVGFARSIVIDEDGTILAGNGVTEAAAIAGIEKVVEVEADGETIVAVRRRGLSEEQKTKLKYYDNRSGELAEWDPLVIVSDLELGIDLSSLWNPDELSVMLEGVAGSLLGGKGNPPQDPGPQIDRAEELQKKWQVQPGDLWQIDRHFVICGDCREPATWERLLKAAGIQKVNGVFTSPPYAEQRKAQYGGVPTAEYVGWWEAVQGNVRANLAEDGSFFVNIKPHCEDGQRVLYVFDLVLQMVRGWGWRFVEEYAWKHQGMPGMGGRRLKNQFEPVYQFSPGVPILRQEGIRIPASDSHIRNMDRKRNGYISPKTGSPFSGGNVSKNFDVDDLTALPGNVIEINNGAINDGIHEATFPLELPTFFIKAYSDPGDSWLDPFLGSGTTIVAAHNEGRTGLGIERLEKYVAVILERLQAVTARDPVRLSE